MGKPARHHWWAFQLTRSRGAWQDFDFTLNKLKDFNSHAHVERDVAMFSVVDLFVNFNSHAHVERDTGNLTALYTRIGFQLTRSRGAWLEYSDNRGQTGNFNSHAHVERDFASPLYHFTTLISTHTLTWSVTMNEYFASGLTNISTHTLTWSVTVVTSNVMSIFSFQLTRSRGAWPTNQ